MFESYVFTTWSVPTIRSFKTEQTHLTLYMTAIASLSTLVGKPIIKVSPENGLNVKISGSSLTGNHPTTLSPSTLVLDWNCNSFCYLSLFIVPLTFVFTNPLTSFFLKGEKTRKTPYEVNVTIPVDGYDPVQFFLTKLCGELIIYMAFSVACSVSLWYNTICFFFRIQPRCWRRISERMGYIWSFFLRVWKSLSQNHKRLVTGELASANCVLVCCFWSDPSLHLHFSAVEDLSTRQE